MALSDSSLSSDIVESALDAMTEEKQLETIQLSSHTPKLIAIINPSSGSNKGAALVPAFVSLGISVYFPEAVAKNTRMRQRLGAELVAHHDRCIVLLCGGDGSNYWATSLLELALSAAHAQPHILPVLLPFPLGSGNDLSRCLGWGNLGISGPGAVLDRVADVLFAAQLQRAPRWTLLDRWALSFAFPDGDGRQVEAHQPLPSAFLCYLSVGYDARIAYDFEVARRKNPASFANQTMNQLVYAKMGLAQLLPARQSAPIDTLVQMRLALDGAAV